MPFPGVAPCRLEEPKAPKAWFYVEAEKYSLTAS